MERRTLKREVMAKREVIALADGMESPILTP